jgi:hypothetical protein
MNRNVVAHYSGAFAAPSPAGFISPARPLLTTKPRAGPEWVHEIKHDGYRLLALKEAGRVVLWSRYATDYSDTFLRIAEAVRALPLAADLSRRPVINGVINARRSAEDLYHEFKAAREVAGSWVESTHEFARALCELSDRLRQQRAEEDRVGLIPDYDERLERAYDVLHAIEDKISDLVPVSILALGADLIPRIERDDDEEADMRAWRATLTAVRFQLIDIIAEDADQVLAQKTEVART